MEGYTNREWPIKQIGQFIINCQNGIISIPSKRIFFSLFSFNSNLFFKIMKPLSSEAPSLLLIQIQIQAVCNDSYLLHYIPI